MADADTLEDMECPCDAVEKFNKEYPMELHALTHKLIVKHRKEVWKLDQKFHSWYFDTLQAVTRSLYKENWAEEKIIKFVRENLSGKKYYESITNGR
jgi:hypothetical protein